MSVIDVVAVQRKLLAHDWSRPFPLEKGDAVALLKEIGEGYLWAGECKMLREALLREPMAGFSGGN